MWFTQSGSLTTDKCDLYTSKKNFFKYLVWYDITYSGSLTKRKVSCAVTKWFKCDLCDTWFIKHKQRQFVW